MSHFVSCFFLAKSVALNIPFIDIAGGVALAGLFNMLPVTIMGLGTRELIFLYLFSSFESSLVIAFSMTILVAAQVGGGTISMLLGQVFMAINKKFSSA
ncbi:MAG: hypothetical protein ACOCQ4_02145 [bacterium]